MSLTQALEDTEAREEDAQGTVAFLQSVVGDLTSNADREKRKYRRRLARARPNVDHELRVLESAVGAAVGAFSRPLSSPFLNSGRMARKWRYIPTYVLLGVVCIAEYDGFWAAVTWKKIGTSNKSRKWLLLEVKPFVFGCAIILPQKHRTICIGYV